MSGGFGLTLSDYYRSRNRTKISETEGCVLFEQSVCLSRILGAASKMTNSPSLLRAKSDEEKEKRVGKVRLLLFFVAAGDKKGSEMAIVQFVECIMSRNTVSSALG